MGSGGGEMQRHVNFENVSNMFDHVGEEVKSQGSPKLLSK